VDVNRVDEAKPERITIRSAEDAWSLFQAAMNKESLPKNLELIFDGWPQFDMKVNGNDWHGTVPTRVMGPLLDVQKDLHRAYTNVCYGTSNLRKLRDEERDLLEIVVKVDKGSSDYRAHLSQQLNELAKKAVDKMESRDVVITVIGIALVVGGVEVNKSWVAQRQKEIQAEVTVSLSQEETSRLKLFSEAMQQKPVLKEARLNFESSQNKILKTVKAGDHINTKGVELRGDQAIEVAQEERAKSVDANVTGIFRVLANDASKGAGFRIKVARLSDGLTFIADVPIELDVEQRNLIQRAEWSKGAVLVNLAISASVLREKISNAVVFSAEEAKEES